jgi:hypothetical protein
MFEERAPGSAVPAAKSTGTEYDAPIGPPGGAKTDRRHGAAGSKEGDMRQIISTMTLAATAALLPLAGCDHGGSQAQQPRQPAADAQRDAQVRLAGMPEAERNAVFIRAIRDANFDCQHVDSSSYQGISAGTPTWLATCDDASNWVILIGSNGSAQVIKGSEIEAVRPRAGQTGR